MKKGKITEYRGVTYRSKWEVYFAKLLLYSDFRFKYEPKRFFLTQTLSYLPDFYLIDYNTYVEIKGVLNTKDRLLIELFRKAEKLIYFGRKELSYIHGKSASNISKLDIAKYVPEKKEVNRFRELLTYLLNKE